MKKGEMLTLIIGAIVIIILIVIALLPYMQTKTAALGDTVRVHYRGALEDGTVFDSSYDRNEPLPFTLGAGEVIKGWDEGIVGMKVGEKKQLRIPPEKAYGAAGVKHPQTGAYIIPPNATLIFDVELISIE